MHYEYVLEWTLNRLIYYIDDFSKQAFTYTSSSIFIVFENLTLKACVSNFRRLKAASCDNVHLKILRK